MRPMSLRLLRRTNRTHSRLLGSIRRAATAQAVPNVAEHLEPRLLLSTYTVTNLNDAGPGSLRDAVKQADVHPGPDTVTFAAGLTGTITFKSGELPIADRTGRTTIAGPGSDDLTIDAAKRGRAFQIADTGSAAINDISITHGFLPLDDRANGGAILNNGTLSLSGCDFTANDAAHFGGGGALFNNGSASIDRTRFSANSSDLGGAILNEGTLSVSASTFAGNSGGSGGAIESAAGNLIVTGTAFSGDSAGSTGGGIGGAGNMTVRGCSFQGETSANFGSGIYVGGMLLITDTAFNGIKGDGIGQFGAAIVRSCTFSKCLGAGISNSGGMLSVRDSQFLGNEGGISNRAEGGDVTVTDCLFSGNASSGYGAGINNIGVMSVSNSTFSGNSAEGGGAISNVQFVTTPTITITNCTIAGNSAGLTGGGGIINSQGTVILRNTIVANNVSAAGPFYSDLVGDTSTGVYKLSYSLIGVGYGAQALIEAQTFDLLGSWETPLDSQLAPLGDYGGPTMTMPPLPGSPAIDAGSNALIPAGVIADQRGDYRVSNGTVDIGAVEYNSVPLLPGDANGDRKVDFSDLLALAQNYQKTPATFSDGDFNSDGSVGFDDLLILTQNYGQSVKPSVARRSSLRVARA